MITRLTMIRSKDNNLHKAPSAAPSGLLVDGLVALVIGLAALIGDIVFKNLMGFVGYVIIAILSTILIITGATRTARALRLRGTTK